MKVIIEETCTYVVEADTRTQLRDIFTQLESAQTELDGRLNGKLRLNKAERRLVEIRRKDLPK